MTTKVNFKNGVIAVAIGVVMVSCGGRGGNQQSGAATSEAKTEQVAPANEVDKSTVAGFLSQFGLTEADVKPANAGETSIGRLDTRRTEGTLSWNIGQNATIEQENVWIQKVVDKTKTLAADRKLLAVRSDTDEFVFSPLSAREDVQWHYRYNEKTVAVRIQLLGYGMVDLKFLTY
jgi:hypothetical protein